MRDKPAIWLVDDDQAVGDIIERAFKKEALSCQVKSFTDAQAIIATIQADRQPTLLLVDQCMPGMDGLTLVEWLKNNPSTRSLKVVLFSQTMTLALVERAQAIGVYEITRKPLNFQDWCKFVKDLCLAGHFS
ncbi:hypothetical protein GCM10027299_44200 [Larkinella ripae]